ncbi:MAG: AI-2E family transporter [Halolamina sp.]
MPARRSLDRTRLLALAFVALTAVSAFVLAEVAHTVVFAVTVAYTLLPFRILLVNRGYSRRVSTAAVTGVAALGLVATVTPIIYVLYRRRGALLGLIRSLPSELTVEFGGFSFGVETTVLVAATQEFLRDAALASASAAAVTSLKALLFAVVVYGLLYRPSAIRDAAFGLVPPDTHEVLVSYHERTHETLVGIYYVQAVTALATGVVAYVVFALLGYGAALTFAVVAGVLQFIPVVGPSLVVFALAAVDVLQGNSPRAALVLTVGLLVVGFLPDAIIRPRLAGMAGDLPTTLYFVGFVGGVLTVGPVGFVVGPLAVALLAETVELLSAGLTTDVDSVDGSGGGGDTEAAGGIDRTADGPKRTGDPDAESGAGG